MDITTLLLASLKGDVLSPEDMRTAVIDRYPLAVDWQRAKFMALGMSDILANRFAWMSVVISSAALSHPEDSEELPSAVTAKYDDDLKLWNFTHEGKVFLTAQHMPALYAGAWTRSWSDGSAIAMLRAEVDQLSHVLTRKRGDFLAAIFHADHLFAASESAINVYRDISVDESVYAIQYREEDGKKDYCRYLVLTYS